MSENKVIKSVSFNKQNEDDKKMLKYFGRRNFSGYVKKLIMEDMKRKEAEKKTKEPAVGNKPDPANEKKAASASEELQRMKQQKREQQAPPAPNVFIKKQ